MIKSAPPRKLVSKIILIGALVALCLVVGYKALGRFDSVALILAELRNLPQAEGYAAFICVLIVAVVSGIIPLSALAMASGVLYGVGVGFVISGMGLAIGASLAFFVSRHWLRQPILKWVSPYISVQALDHNILLRGWQLAILLRISPVAPFGVVSYAFGLTSVTFAQFLVGLLGSFPAMLVYVYSGAVSGEMLRAFFSGDPQIDHLRVLLLVLGLVATAAAVWLFTRIIRDTLTEVQALAGAKADMSKAKLDSLLTSEEEAS